jgi:lipopolysaccharide biosynthesis regulator YciM
MSFDLWPWLLLAALAFFGAGWLFARIDIKQLLSESRALPQSYFRGLNFLLNEQPDKAIEAFMEVTRAQPEAVELQFALGSLFRRRGEVDRAIRVHQNLSERGDLPAEQRTTALLELAQDFQKSGLLDHAERILADLVGGAAGTVAQRSDALRMLLDIYVQEHDWRKAIDVARRMDGESAEHAHAREIANYFCELAIEQHAAGAIEEASASLDAALEAHPRGVRANLIRGEWLAANGQHTEAIAAWRRIEQQDPAYLGLMADQMLSSYEALGQGEQGLSVLRELQRLYPALDLLNALFRATLKSEGPEAAYQLVKSDLRINPTLVGLDRLLEAQVLAAPPERKEDLVMLKDLVHSHSSRLAVYLCAHCGFKAKQFYWHCPACSGWETFPPRRTAEYDTAERHLARSQAGGE